MNETDDVLLRLAALMLPDVLFYENDRLWWVNSASHGLNACGPCEVRVRVEMLHICELIVDKLSTQALAKYDELLQEPYPSTPGKKQGLSSCAPWQQRITVLNTLVKP
jgi:hypothetical protein